MVHNSDRAIHLKCSNLENITICSPYLEYNRVIGLISRVFANGLGDQGSIPGRVIPTKTQKMVLDPALLNT